jgi:PAS domain S-box-containing protein
MPIKTQADFDLLFDALPQSYIVFDIDDPSFTIVAENKAHGTVAMVNRDDVVGKPLLEAFPDTSPKYLKTGVSDLVESIRKVVRTAQPEPMEDLRYDLKRPDGTMERRYWRVVHHPIFDDAGEVEYVIQSTINVTEEVKVGRKLDEAQRQLDEALAIGLIGTWLWDLKDDYIVADKNLLRLFGLRPEEAVDGLPLTTFTHSIHPEDRPRIVKVIEDTVARKGSFEEEYRTIAKDGEMRWVIARGRVEVDEAGNPERFPGVIVDISERKITELNLRFLSDVSAVLSSSLDYNETLKLVTELAVPELADWCAVDILVDGAIKQVAVAHKDPKKVAWAKRLRKTSPVKLDDPTGVPAVLRTGQPEFFPRITDEMLVASSPNPEQLKIARSLNLTSIIIVPLTVRGEHIGALTLVSSELMRHYTPADLQTAIETANRASLAIANADLYKTAQEEIEARKLLEEQLREANERLETRVQRRTAELEESNENLKRSNRELEDFAYVASHDLQEPLRKIQAFGNLLEEEFGANLGEGRDYLERMRNAASRMSVLIEDLLSFSRVTTKANPLVKVDLDLVVREVLEDLEVSVGESGATVTVGKLPSIKADRLQMRQLFQNLIGNAIKFSQPGIKPEVNINAVIMDAENDATIKCCQITVKDHGIGFDEKYLDRIFSVFQRLHGKDVYQGTGIGLAICRKIVERHGGTITAKSRINKGSTFIITLPASGTGRGAGDSA